MALKNLNLPKVTPFPTQQVVSKILVSSTPSTEKASITGLDYSGESGLLILQPHDLLVLT